MFMETEAGVDMQNSLYKLGSKSESKFKKEIWNYLKNTERKGFWKQFLEKNIVWLAKNTRFCNTVGQLIFVSLSCSIKSTPLLLLGLFFPRNFFLDDPFSNLAIE